MAVTLEQIQKERARRAALKRVQDERLRRQSPAEGQLAEGQLTEAQQLEQGGGIFPKPTAEMSELAGRAIAKVAEDKKIAAAEAAKQMSPEERAEREAKNQATVDRMRAVLTEGPRVAGSVVGGIIGGPLGAAALGGAGEMLGESARLLVGTQEEKDEASKKEFTDLVKDLSVQSGKAGIEEGLWDLAGGAVAKTGGLVFSPVIKKIAPKASAMASTFANLGGKFSPAELDRRGFLQFLESASRNSLEGKQLFKAFVDDPSDRAISKMMKIVANDLSEGIGKLEPDMIADALSSTIKGVDSSFDEVLGPAWSQLDDLTRNATVQTAGLKDFAEKEIFELAEIEGIGGSAELESILNKVDKLGPFVSFKGMRRIKRDLFRQVKSLNVSGDVADGVAKRLGSLAEEALLDPSTMKGASKEARMLHSNLKNAYSSGKRAFNDTFPSKIIDNLVDPRAKASTIKRLFPDKGIDNIKNVRNTLTKTIKGTANPEGAKTWNKLQRLWLEDLVTRSTNASGKITSKALENNITKFGPKAVKEILGPEQAKALRLIRGIAGEKQVDRANLSFLVRSIQIGGALTATGAGPGDEPLGARIAGGGIAIAPAAFALLAGNKPGNALLRAGLKLPKGSKALPGIVLKMNAAIRRERNKDSSKKKTKPRIRKEHLMRMR